MLSLLALALLCYYANATSEPCYDRDSECTKFAAWGECSTNPQYMKGKCPASCGVCGRGPCNSGEEFISLHYCDFMCSGYKDKCPGRHQTVTPLAKCGCKPGYVRKGNQAGCIPKSSCSGSSKPDYWFCDSGRCINLGPNPPIADVELSTSRSGCEQRCGAQPPGSEFWVCTGSGYCAIDQSIFPTPDRPRFRRRSDCELQCKGNPTCPNSDNRCPGWARRGECTTNPFWMQVNCRGACGTCHIRGYEDVPVPPVIPTPSPGCNNYDNYCKFWAYSGYCTRGRRGFVSYVKYQCPLSCNVCPQLLGGASGGAPAAPRGAPPPGAVRPPEPASG